MALLSHAGVTLPVPVLSACLALGILDAVHAQQPTTGQLRLTVAVVTASYEIKPLPLFVLEVVSQSDSTQRHVLRTSLTGLIDTTLPAQAYRLRALNAARIADSSYTWDLALTVAPGPNVLELTNQNAVVQYLGARPSDEGSVYLSVRAGVFRIEAGLGHGTGFLADTLGGVILTNAHVVEGVDTATVTIDSTRRVKGVVIARDEPADVAIIRISPDACSECPRLPLARSDGTPIVMAGEKLIAIGFPLSQEQTLTSGIASSVREGAIISDVNINPGNSGGPLLNLRGEVVAINTFGEGSERIGPGVSGSIVVSRAGPALDTASLQVERPVPSSTLLPLMPRETYPLEVLRSYADTLNKRRYRKFDDLNTGSFTVSVATPVTRMMENVEIEREVGRDRRRREEQAGVVGSAQWSSLKRIKDWTEYVGSDFTPVVTFTIDPKLGETTGSALFRVLISPYSRATLKFSGDLRYARLYRNREQVEPIRGGHGPVPAYIDNAWVKLKDVADRGFYVYGMDTFAPDSTGKPPELILEISDLKHPDRNVCQLIPFELSEVVWNDFEPMVRTLNPAAPFTMAVSRGVRDDTRARRRFLEECYWLD